MDNRIDSNEVNPSRISPSPEISRVGRYRALVAALMLAGGSGLLAYGTSRGENVAESQNLESSVAEAPLKTPEPKEPEVAVEKAVAQPATGAPVEKAPEPLKKEVSVNAETKRISIPKPVKKAEKWSSVDSNRRMSSVLFLGLTQGETSYDIQEEARKSGFDKVDGIPQVLHSFDRLTDVLMSGNPDAAEVKRAAEDYMRNFERLWDLQEIPENRKMLVSVIESMPSDFDEGPFMVAIKMGGQYAYCMAHGKCTMEEIEEAERVKNGK